MKNMFLLRWMEDIDPILIERADRYVSKHRSRTLRTLLIAAAAALLIVAMLSAVSLMMLDSYAEQNYPEYDGTVLHALDFVLTQDQNPVAEALGEQNRASLHTLFNALRGIESEPEPEPEPQKISRLAAVGASISGEDGEVRFGLRCYLKSKGTYGGMFSLYYNVPNV